MKYETNIVHISEKYFTKMDENKSKLTDLFKNQFNESVTKLDNNQTILMDLLANEWIQQAKKLPDPKPLFGSIWHQGEVAFLFSNTGKGKSILGVQLAESIASGIKILSMETTQQKTILFDFELSSKSFQRRYTNENNISHLYSTYFIRVEIDRSKSLESEDKSFEELIIESITYHIEKSKAEVIIIDNVTFLSSTN